MGLYMSRPLPRGRYRLGFLAGLERDWRGLRWFGTTIGLLSGVGLFVWVPFSSFFGSVGHTLRSVARPVGVRPVWYWFCGSLGVVWLGCSAGDRVFSMSHCGLFPGGSLGSQNRTISRPLGVFSVTEWATEFVLWLKVIEEARCKGLRPQCPAVAVWCPCRWPSAVGVLIGDEVAFQCFRD
jgi:hypothetical protein